MKSVLFVCMANICRSPVLEATLRHLAIQKGLGDKFHIDSCGIGWFHLGERCDARVFEAAKKKGILIDHRAQQFREEFFETFDLILTVDSEISEQLKLHAKTEDQKKKIHLVSEFSKKFKDLPMPDPYYMSPDGFSQMMDMAIDCCEGILKKLS